MLIGGIALGLVLGLLAGRSLLHPGPVRLRPPGLLVVALALRVATEFLLNAGVGIVDTLRVPLFAISFGLLLAALWVNRGYPGFSLAFIGTASNAIVILVNGGYMPIWEPALNAAGMTAADVQSAIHYVLPPPLDANFLLHLGPLADVIPIPVPFLENVASIGDVFITAGLAFFLFAAVVRIPQELDEDEQALVQARLVAAGAPTRPSPILPERRPRPGDPGAETGLSPALTATVALERPLVLGSAGTGLASPSLETFESDDRVPQTLAAAAATSAAALPAAPAIVVPIPEAPVEVAERVRQHPYVRLALNGSFSALWAGQLIS